LQFQFMVISNPKEGIGQFLQLAPIDGLQFYQEVCSQFFNPGDLIIDKKVDVSDLKVGDVVTYIFGERFLSTHRVVEINKDNNGKLTFKNKRR